jgi:hypothetical protein
LSHAYTTGLIGRFALVVHIIHKKAADSAEKNIPWSKVLPLLPFRYSIVPIGTGCFEKALI